MIQIMKISWVETQVIIVLKRVLYIDLKLVSTTRAISHSSRTLIYSEKYNQIEKKGLARSPFKQITYHFLQYSDPRRIYQFTQQIDFKRWALILKAYNFKIEYVRTAGFRCADIFSRLISSNLEQNDEIIIFQIETEVCQNQDASIENLLVNFSLIYRKTEKDKTL